MNAVLYREESWAENQAENKIWTLHGVVKRTLFILDLFYVCQIIRKIENSKYP